ncbi:MAG: LysR substrate-binding domain-containing protein [Phenylobacterium sp.]|uniref:LysR substrate-binding domain-containing protein n=1 Tax=Phenylobacterium sp. TaxID=1871053 RepID=UPI00391C12F9
MPKRTLPPLTALRAFEAFARLGRMNLAADELCVTHGAVSRQVRSLERLCGVRLTHGPRNRLRLTEAGAEFALGVAAAFDSLETSYLALKSSAERELHVSCVGTLAMRWLIPRLAGFHARHPELRIRVTEAYGPVDFLREPFDAAIRLAEQVSGEGLQATAFLENYHGPVLAPALLGRHGDGLAALAAVPRLHTRPHRQAWREWAAHAGVPLREAAENREFEHLFYMLEAAAAGLGAGVTPWIYVAGDIASGRLAAPLGFVKSPARFHFIVPEGPPRPALAAFRDWLMEEARAAPPPPARRAAPVGAFP